MTDEDRQKLADLALRALDTIAADYGDDAELVGATIVFEVRVTDEDGDPLYHGNFKSLEGMSPHHVGGLLAATGEYIFRPWKDPDGD